MSEFLTATEKMLAGLRAEDNKYLTRNFFVKTVAHRGRSVFAKKAFKKDDFMMEYKGICKEYCENEYMSLQSLYKKNEELSYCLEFTFQKQKYYIDATREYKYGFARLINHARNPNLKVFKPLLVDSEQLPRVAMYAGTNIAENDELFWDYFSSMNPAKCLLDEQNKIRTPDMQWMFSRRKKSGGITCCRAINRIKSNRSGICMICCDFKKKLSNHLIKIHSIESSDERRKLIQNGRKADISQMSRPTSKNLSRRRSLRCPLCVRDYKQLSTHLARVHKFNDEKRRTIVSRSRQHVLSDEIKKRKAIFCPAKLNDNYQS